MYNEDSIHLLKECNAGTKMAISSINEVKDKVKDKELGTLLAYFLKEHEVIENKTHKKLALDNDTDKEPNPIAQVMSWAKINAKLLIDPTDKEIAELMIDGCNMGIKSVSRYMNQYPTAVQEVQTLTEDLVKLEQHFMDSLRRYL